MPEVDADTYELLTRSHNVLMKLNGDSRTRPDLEKAIKVHFPEVTTEAEAGQRLIQPHLEALNNDVINPLAAELKALREEREAAKTAASTAHLETTFSDLRKTRGFTDDGIEAVKKLMVDNNIADPLAAAARFSELNPPAQDISGFTPPAWNLDQTASDFDVKGLFADEDKWGDTMAVKVLNEIRVGQAA